MAPYKHILCATDLSARAPELARRALDLAQRCGARVSFLHVIEERDWGAGSVIEQQPHEATAPGMAHARDQLAALTRQIGVPDAEVHVVVAGSAGAQIRHVAESIGADLIVVGSRGRHGLALMFGGSTPDEVMHGANCDMLAVWIAH